MPMVSQIMTKNPKSVGPATSIRSAAKTMRTAKVSSLLIKKGKAHIGIITDTDLVRKALGTDKNVAKMTVEDIMTTPLCSIESDSTVDEAQDMMGDLNVRHLAVTKNGSVVGMVSVRDLLAHYKRYAQSKISTEVKYSEPKISQD
ncbi:MAG: CBS domain-containing protein [Nitrospiraceae bacterium]|nr:CBS domain-containing protein [Nitrospiraceae bacterium]